MQDKSERRAIFAAMAAAYHAKSGSLQPEGVIWLEAQVAQLLPLGGEVRECVDRFVSGFCHNRRDPEAVMVLADRLLDNVRRLLEPELPGSDRKDIHG